MFKLINLSLIIVVVAAVMFSAVKLTSSTIESNNETGTSAVLADNTELVKHAVVQAKGEDYEIAYSLADTDSIVLIPNFEEKKVAKNVFEDSQCTLLINGGFYDRTDSAHSPIGYFEVDGDVASNFQKNKLFDGVLSINKIGTPRITRDVPIDPLVSAVQTGPILVENDSVLSVSSGADKKARRMVASVTGKNELIFMAVYSADSTFTGPLLADLPEIVNAFEEKTDINIADAINLDGGAASAFFAEDFSLSEFSPVGSFFCVKR
jgi:uncharacterized protein YigE (DUF2233 family)